MSDASDRLKITRERAGYSSASDAARAVGVGISTYTHHENGTRKLLPDVAERYARFFRVDLEWLLTGRQPKRAEGPSVDIVGKVGAGANVYGLDHDTTGEKIGDISWPSASAVVALEVQGDSQYPRYLAGEHILVRREPSPPSRLVGRYALVVTNDGRHLVKMIRRMPGMDGLYRLESHNAPPEDDVTITTAYEVIGTLDT